MPRKNRKMGVSGRICLWAKTVSANRAASQTTRVSQQEGASQPTGRRESANQGGASQTTRLRVRQPGQPGRASDNQVASQTTGREPANQVTSQPTRSRVRQPGRASDNQVASQTTRSRVRQPGRESANQVASQPTRSRVRQPGRESDNQVASQTTRSRVRQPAASQTTGREGGEGGWGGRWGGVRGRGRETFVQHRHMQLVTRS